LRQNANFRQLVAVISAIFWSFHRQQGVPRVNLAHFQYKQVIFGGEIGIFLSFSPPLLHFGASIGVPRAVFLHTVVPVDCGARQGHSPQ